MTFAAQPYERFVDDLLTALTGGIIREEHPFKGMTDAASKFTIIGVDPTSLQVFGQSSGVYTLFKDKIDYEYDAVKGVLSWKTDGKGKLPDEQSFFYVNYALSKSQQRLTDRNPGSVTRTLAESFAREYAVVDKQMQMIYESAYVDTAKGTSLDHVAALLGVERKDAHFATGEVLFKRTTPAPADIVISAGTVVSTESQQNFETTDRRTLRRGQLSVLVPIRAVVKGQPGKVDAGLIKIVNRPLFGLEAVINEQGTFFATQKETDEELRRRIKGTLERAGKATVNAIKYSLIEDVAEITEANIQVFEVSDTPGRVEVRLGIGSEGTADLVRRVEESIFYARPAGVHVTHNLSTRSPSASELQAANKTGISRLQAVADYATHKLPLKAREIEAEVLARMEEGILDMQVEVMLTLVEMNLSAAQKEAIVVQVRSVVTEYIEQLPMGSPLVYSKLLGRIVQSESIADAEMLVGAQGGEMIFFKNVATVDRKARIDNYHIFVGLMEEVIFIDLTVQLEPIEQQTSTDANGASRNSLAYEPVRITPQLKASLREAMEQVITGASRLLTRDTLLQAARDKVKGADRLKLTETDSLILNAEYEETGRLLNHTAEVIAAEYERLKLREFDVKIPGALDV